MKRLILVAAIISLLSQPALAEQPGKTKKVLQGRVDTVGDLCSSAGVTLSSQNMPTTVESIRTGSPAYYSGLAEGDKVMAGKIADNRLYLQIDRKGQRYAVTLPTMYNPLSAKGQEAKTQTVNKNAQNEVAALSELAKYDVVLVVDRSGSMNEPVDASGVTKWKFCEDNISEFTSKIQPYLTREGVELVIFGSTFTVQKGCSAEIVRAMFTKVKPEESTDLSAPLKALFDQYFAGNRTKPMLIAVMTDGMPNRGTTLNDLIIKTTQRLRSADEIRLVFMQIGDEFEGRALVDTLDDYLVHNGAKFDIVDSVAFGKIKHGVLDPLIVTLHHDYHPVSKKASESSVEITPFESSIKIEPRAKKPSEP